MKLKMKIKETKEFYYFVSKTMLQFLIASFVGWLYEVATVYCLFRTYYDRGVLHLPLCPIYGVGMLVLLLIFHRVKNTVVIFMGSVTVTTAVELAASYVLEHIYGYSFWTYEGWPLNFQNRVSLISSCIFGLMALLFFKIIRPVTDKLYTTKAKKMVTLLVYLMVAGCILWEIQYTKQVF